MFFLGLDPAELNDLDRRVRGFGHNRWALVGVHDRDFGPSGDESIRAGYEAVLARALDRVPTFDRLTVMAIPRIGGYVFAPVTFVLCLDGDRLSALIAEVRNTFGEKHHYVAVPERSGDQWTCRIPKRFYVSPFLDTQGEYGVRVRMEDDQFEIEIDLHEGGELVFSAGMRGQGQALTTRSLLTTVARMPFFAARIMPRIHWQALHLIAKGIRTRLKPAPVGQMTMPAPRSSVWYRVRHALVRIARRPAPRKLIAEGEL